VSEILVTEHRLPVQTACRAVGLSRTAWYRRPADRAIRDAAVVTALLAVVEQQGRWGFWKCFDRLRLDGHRWNHKRVHRVYCALRLNLPRRTKRRVPTRLRQPLVAPLELNGIWALDFMQDALYGGRRFRTLNVLDEANREALAIEIGTSIPAARVVRVLEQLVTIYGRPQALRLDNGPELTAQIFADWCQQQGIGLRYIQPGKPDQNAFIERFNRTYREEVLNAYVFESLAEVQAITEEWLRTYNDHRPHDALGSIPPTRFRSRPTTLPESTYELCP
jgi:putative transposase